MIRANFLETDKWWNDANVSKFLTRQLNNSIDCIIFTNNMNEYGRSIKPIDKTEIYFTFDR